MKTECKKRKNTQNILLDGCYLILRSIFKRKKICFYFETEPRNRPNQFKESFREGKLVKNF